jgi:hypothetical protein
MLKRLLLLLLFLTPIVAHAQVSIIQDKDGYTNVRAKADGKSAVIYRLKSNEVFWYDYEESHDKEEWITVTIPLNKFALDGNLCSTESKLNGFIHKSRLLPLDKLKPYTASDFNFQYSVKKFDAKSHLITYRYENVVILVDGRHPWGTDGNLPKSEVEKITVSIEGNIIDIPKILYGDIFECDNDFDVYRVGDTFFVHQWNSDGAGAYEIIWVITREGVIQRLVGNMV